MNSNKIKVSVGLLAVFVLVSSAYPWGSATHAYIADHIGRILGLNNSNEMYGAMAPDIFNYMFSSPYMPYLENQTHGVFPSDVSFLKVWYNASWGLQKALAYGWVCHNDVWGADSVAHHKALIDKMPVPYPYDPGWVIIKAFELEGRINLTGYLKGLGMGQVEASYFAIEICHNLIETAGDILLKDYDFLIGAKVMSAALLRSADFPGLLVKAYALDFSHAYGLSLPAASLIITTAEKSFKDMMVQYGGALLQSKDVAVQALAGQMADLASAFLGGQVQLPPKDEVVALLAAGTIQAIDICKTNNCFIKEVNAVIVTLIFRMLPFFY
jgi:hypothetical protein